MPALLFADDADDDVDAMLDLAQATADATSHSVWVPIAFVLRVVCVQEPNSVAASGNNLQKILC